MGLLLSRRRWDAVVVWAGGAGIVLSAVFYLLHFASTLVRLRAYYGYEYQCPHAAPTSALLRHDPICLAIRSGFRLHNYSAVFWVGVVQLLLAHLTYAIIFWLSLPSSHHPLRLAYFLPFVHLHRLLKLLLSCPRSTRVKEFIKSQKELSGLYDALGLALETAPQSSMQFGIALNFGQYFKGSSNPAEQAQSIPKVLLFSLITSTTFGTYGATISMFYALENRMPLFERAFISILSGIQVFSILIAKGVCVASLFHFTSHRFSIPLVVLLVAQFIIAWLFSCLVVNFHYRCTRKSTWKKAAHSLGLALMTRIIGPMYILTKLETSLCMYFWGAIFHLLGESICPIFVFYWHLHVSAPCRASERMGLEEQGNKYLTCKMYKGITFPAYFVFMFTTLLAIWVYKKGDKGGSYLPTNSREISSKENINCPLKGITSKSVSHNLIRGIHTSRVYTLFDCWVFLLTIICIQVLNRKIVPKAALNTHPVFVTKALNRHPT